MSSEEVAELAEAIHSHADALYESWTKGATTPRTDVMRRMEDTLELLADPELTPSLEHLVSNFVKQDKAKRQQFGSTTTNNMKLNNIIVGRNRSLSPRLMDSVGEENNSSPRVLSPQSNNNRKILPKSILAVVQRFESVPIDSTTTMLPNRVPSPSFMNNSTGIIGPSISTKSPENNYGNVLLNEKHHHIIKLSPEISEPISNHHHRVQHTGDHKYSTSDQKLNNNSSVGLPLVREHRIPIVQRNDELLLGNMPEYFDSVKSVRPTEPIITLPKDVTPSNKTHIISVNLNSPNRTQRAKSLESSSKSQGIKDLEREEERLVHALRTGQVVIPNEYRQSPTNNNDDMLNNNNSQVAFAKERIRQSQEHPLTQQRLEHQKKLPTPSSNLAAGIALQQGRIKFQSINNGESAREPPQTRHHHIRIEGDNESIGLNTNGRQSWVSAIHRFGPGSSVADRVQQFEKYPIHFVHNGSSTVDSSKNFTNQNQIDTNQVQHHHHHHYSNHLPSLVNSQQSPKEITHPIRKINTHYHKEESNSLGDPPSYDSLSHSILKITSDNVDTKVAPWRVATQQQQQNVTILRPDFQSPKHPKTPTSLDCSKKFDFYVPRFYWPEGKPPPTPYIQETLSKAEGEFNKFSTPFLNYEDFGKFLQNIGICLYWKKPFWMGLGLQPNGTLEFMCFKKFYNSLISQCPDEASRFMRILWTGKSTLNQTSLDCSDGTGLEKFSIEFKKIELGMSDFVPMIQDIVDTHPGLGFLRAAPEFHTRYVTTVISRIFYKVNRSWTGKLNLSEIRRSNLLQVIKRLEEETDVNTITEYFSYEHFYVIYCKFWELDKDHDLLIDKADLAGHNEQALSNLIIDRIFRGTVLRGWDMNSTARVSQGKMTYSDFVWFILSEEDKKTSTAIEYWFRCLDLDGDGILSSFELQHFYREQEHRIESLGIEPLDFANVFCQIVDMLRCSPKGVRLKDLKRNPQLASNFFNTLFNLDKYLDHEQRDPFATSGTGPGLEFSDTGESDWDRYASTEYELLIAEESPSDHVLHDSSDFEEIPS